MYFMNDYDLYRLEQSLSYRAPSALPYLRFLNSWVDIVNANSDGWAHWSGGPKAAKQLMLALDAIANGGAVEVKALNKALGPIKACATRHKLPCPNL